MSQALSNVFKLKDIINVKDPAFGAKGDGVTDDTAAIQAAINSIASGPTKGGGVVFFPPGFYLVSSFIQISAGAILLGSGAAVGAGTGNSGGTVIRMTNPNDDIFYVESNEGVVFRDMAIDAPGVTMAGGTAGIRITERTLASINRQSRVENCAIRNMFDGIVLDLAADFVLANSKIQDYLNIGLYTRSIGAGMEDSGGQNAIYGNVIWDLNVGTSQACIRYDKGGDLRVTNNKLLGGDYGFRLVLDDGPTGTLTFAGNSVEQQAIYCMRFEQGVSGKKWSNAAVTGNQFSVLGPVNAQGVFSVVAGISANWIDGITFTGNVCNMGTTQAQPHINIQDGTGVTIANNEMTNLSNSGPTAIAVGGNATGVRVLDNNIRDYPSGKYAAGINANTILRDLTGLTFSALPAPQNGSEIYVTDGTKNSDPLTGSGSGAWARRIQGAWVGT